MSTQRLFALIALAAIGVVIAWLQLNEAPVAEEPEARQSIDSTSTSTAPLELPVLRAAPALTELDGWLQTEASSLDDFSGKVVVLQFWTFSCRNCTATIPNLQEIYRRYDREQVEIVGVHAPEFSFEEDPQAVLEAAGELGVSWPIALDTKKRNFHSWQEGRTAYWPRTYVIDPDGQIRFDHIGEGKYQQLQEAVAALVADL